MPMNLTWNGMKGIIGNIKEHNIKIIDRDEIEIKDIRNQSL